MKQTQITGVIIGSLAAVLIGLYFAFPVYCIIKPAGFLDKHGITSERTAMSLRDIALAPHVWLAWKIEPYHMYLLKQDSGVYGIKGFY